MKSKQFESLRSKLLKLQTLAERGCDGEVENAKRAIERLCAKYGVTLEEVLEVHSTQQYTFNVGRSKQMAQLFFRCLGFVVKDLDGWTYSQVTRSLIELEMTPLQYTEVSSLFEWHKANYKKELENFQRDFFAAYVGKHDLYSNSERNNANDVEEMTPERLERINKILKMRDCMSNDTYHKQLK